MESDLILLYPSEEKINILLIEVKKSRAENFKNTGLVSEAFAQLVRDVRFILALIPDFHPEKVAIRTYAAFPEEPNIDGLFCNNCRQHVLSQEDFSLGFLHLATKMSISTKDIKLNDLNETLMKTLCARMIGHESDENSYKSSNKYFINYQETVDNLIMFDEDQKHVLETLEENPKVKNFSFSGPPGSGKTIVAMKLCKNFIQKYSSDEKVEKIFVYAVVFDVSKDMQLLKTFQETFYDSTKVTVKCMKFTDLKEKVKSKTDVSKKIKESIQNRNLYIIWNL